MRIYFTVLSSLLLVAIFISYKIATALKFERLDGQASVHSATLLNDNDTSTCFEKRYSPQVRECGGLLTYSAPAPPYVEEKHLRRPSGRRTASERTNARKFVQYGSERKSRRFQFDRGYASASRLQHTAGMRDETRAEDTSGVR